MTTATHEPIHALAAQLARPIVRGHMPGRHAYAALAVAALRLPDGETVLPAAWQTLHNYVAWERAQRAGIARRIRERVAPLIADHRARNVLLAQAHGLNGETGFWLTEEEVTDLVATEVWHSLPQSPRGRRRGP